MQEKPKRVRRYAILYLTVGILIGLVLVGGISIIGLILINEIFTFNNLVEMHLAYPLFLFIDVIVLYSILFFAWFGLEKDRAANFHQQSDWLTQNHQRELQLLHENRAKQTQNHEQELHQLHESQAEQNQKHKQELQQLIEARAEQDQKHQVEIAELNVQLDEQRKKFQDLEAVIQRGKQHWEATFDAVDDLIILTDEAGVILRCNRATGELFQLGYSQIIGRGVDEFFSNDSGSLQDTPPGEKKEIKQPHSDVWYESSKNHLLMNGKQEGWVCVFRDITAQKQALREQKRLTQYYELLVNNCPAAIVTLNQEDRIIDCNRAFESLFHYSKQEALGWRADLLISPPDLVYETRGMADAVRQGETVHQITQRRRKDGSLVEVEVFGIPVILGGKQVVSLTLYHDVSELVRSQKGLPDDLGQVSGEAEQALLTKYVEDAFTSQSTPVETTAEAPEAVEALPLQGPGFDQGGEEQQGVLQPSGEAVAIPPLIHTRKRVIPIEKIEGIGPTYALKLSELGVKTTDDLLELCKSRKSREELVERTGISASKVLKWVNMADLMRVHGIGEEYSELLEKAGVDTVKELRNRNPVNLTEALVHANEAHKLVRRAPHLSEVECWIQEAKELEPILTY